MTFAKDRLDRMHEILAGYVDRGDLPGLVTLVSRKGETHVDVIGNASFSGPPLRRDTIFRIASITKPVAAAAAMLLVEGCRLRLDDPVDDLLPELADMRVLRRIDGPIDDTVAATRPVTPRDLLTLRLGTGYAVELTPDAPIQQELDRQGIATGPMPSDVAGSDEWIRRLGSLPLLAQPGERFLYDTGLDALGVLIERASGQPLDAFLRDHIFAPLGMRDTGFQASADRLPVAYIGNPETGRLDVFDDSAGRWSAPPPFLSAAGGLVSTVDDVLAFGRLFLTGGRHGSTRLLARPTVQLMMTDQLTADQRGRASDFLGTNRGWGLGMSVILRRDQPWGSPGWVGWEGGYGTFFGSDPAEDLVAVLMTQRVVYPLPTSIHNDFWTLVYQAIDD